MLQPVPSIHNRVAIGMFAFAKAPDIGTGAEPPPGPGNDDDTDLGVEFGCFDGLHPFIDHERCKGVKDLGAI
jgi:hypothetical protein